MMPPKHSGAVVTAALLAARGNLSAAARSLGRPKVRCVAGSISQNTGRMPCQLRAWAVAMKVKDGSITSPFRPNARIASSRAMVPLATAMQCLTPQKLANSASND